MDTESITKKSRAITAVAPGTITKPANLVNAATTARSPRGCAVTTAAEVVDIV